MPTLRDAEALVGVPYVPGIQDCMHLVLRAAAELFGRTVTLRTGSQHPVTPRRQMALIAEGVGTLARPLAPGEAEQSGDLLLWLAHGPLGPHYHVGTLLLEGGERWVLHSLAEAGASVLQRVSDTRSWGMRLEGTYRWL